MIAVRLKELLAERQESLAHAARATRLSYSTVHRLYSGKAKRIDLATLGALCTHLGAQPSEIIHWQDGVDDLAEASLEEKMRRWPDAQRRLAKLRDLIEKEHGLHPDSTPLIRAERDRRGGRIVDLPWRVGRRQTGGSRG